MYDEVITSEDRLRQIVGSPSHRMGGKAIDHIDPICAKYIEASPYIVICTKGRDGLMDQSPKGDPAGFVQVLDNKRLVIPERPGNKRADSFSNLVVNPEIGIIFLIPGFDYILRVAGTAEVVRDKKLQAQCALQGKEPVLLTVVTVQEAFVHCAKSIARSKLWKCEEWPDSSDVPSYAISTVAHAEIAETVDEMQALIDDDFSSRMY